MGKRIDNIIFRINLNESNKWKDKQLIQKKLFQG